MYDTVYKFMIHYLQIHKCKIYFEYLLRFRLTHHLNKGPCIIFLLEAKGVGEWFFITNDTLGKIDPKFTEPTFVLLVMKLSVTSRA